MLRIIITGISIMLYTISSLLVFPVPSGPPFASLEASAESIIAGDTFNITCTVLGEPEVDVSFSWKFPGQVRGTGSLQKAMILMNFWTTCTVAIIITVT